jgi:hypothetical protein
MTEHNRHTAASAATETSVDRDLSPIANAGSFPGRTITAICMVAGPLLGLIGSLCAIGIYSADGPTFIRGIAAAPSRFAVGINVQLASMMVLLFAIIGLAQLVSARHPALGRTGGTLTILGLCGPIFFEGIYWGGAHLTAAADQVPAATMYDASQIVPTVIMNISGPCLIAGFIVLGVGAARSGTLSRPMAVLLAITCILPAGFILGIISISAAAFVCLSVALVPLGIRMLRRPQVG